MIDFAGWLMPVQYTSILDEHRAVRERVGLFDLSHMGELIVEGPSAGDALAAAIVTDPPALAVGRAHYSMICAPDGGIIDDLIVYRLAEDRFMVVANAGNAAIVSDTMAERLAGTRAVLDDQSLATGLDRHPGPALARGPGPAHGRRPRRTALLRHRRGPGRRHPGAGGPDRVHGRGRLRGLRHDRPDRRALGRADRGGPARRTACRSVSGARDTLRLEAGMPLYGNELDRTTTPFDAGLGRVVKLTKAGDFVGRAALEKVVADGPKRRLVGLIVEGRGIARHGYPVHVGERRTGIVTSGTQSPTLGVPIAMAYVAPGDAEPGTMVDVEIRDARVPARVVPLPFYRRSS